MKRIFNLPRQATQALDEWKNKNIEQKGINDDKHESKAKID